MARVERGNVVLNVEDDAVQHYLNLGYNLTDNHGNVLKRSIPTSLGELQTAYINHTTRIAELEDTVAKLTTENAELKALNKGTNAPTKTSKKKSQTAPAE
jgi:hypothetical protein